MPSKNSSDDKPIPASGYEFYILRHGQAAPRGGSTDDAKRPLTSEGKVRMEQIARGFARLGLALDWIVTSPLVRAQETARIIADSLGDKIPLDVAEELRPGGSPEALMAFLAKHPERHRIMVVGHEPDLSDMAARLIGAGRDANLAFKKGGCCLITFDEFPPQSPGQLVWWLTPRVLRRVG